MPVGPEDRGVDLHLPHNMPDFILLDLRFLQNVRPDPIDLPAPGDHALVLNRT